MLERYNQLLFDILLYLPVMSLLRFKTVCKSWFSVIESSDFITQYLKFNSDKEDNLIILNQHWNLQLKRYEMHLFMHSGSQYEDRAYIDFNRLFWHPVNQELVLTGSCNGIICLEHNKSFDIALWNPALKQLRLLPQPLFSSESVEDTILSYSYGAFGIDVETNDYKVLKIFILLSEECEVLGNQVEVYNMGDDSWRIIHRNGALPFLMTDHLDVTSPCSNGKCFWIRRGSCSPCLISFDFTNEVFGTLSLPNGEHDPFDSCKLDIFDDKIIYIRVRDDYNNFHDYGIKLEIWMLCEDGMKESWSKIYMTEPLPPLDRMISPIGLSKNGNFFICKKFDTSLQQRLYLYDLHTLEGKFLRSEPYQIMRYTPSLNSVRSANGT